MGNAVNPVLFAPPVGTTIDYPQPSPIVVIPPTSTELTPYLGSPAIIPGPMSPMGPGGFP